MPTNLQSSFATNARLQLAITIAVTVATLMIFRAMPEWDLQVSRLSFVENSCVPGDEKRECDNFPVQYIWYLEALREASLKVPYILCMLLFGWLNYDLYFRHHTRAGFVKDVSLSFGTIGLATLLLINLILKGQWGRPRPYQVREFGGDHPFVLPGTITDYCNTNCSFVSGEASSAAWLVTLLVFVPSRWRWPAGIAVGCYTIFFAGLRVAYGRHFLSDVVLSVLITLCVYFLLRVVLATGFFQKRFESLARRSNRVAIGTRD